MPDVREPGIYFTGHSQAVVGQGEVNKRPALENAETSAVGRALAFMGNGVIDSVASVDEMNKSAGPVPAKQAIPTAKPSGEMSDKDELTTLGL